MLTVLLPAIPLLGHVRPLAAIGAALAGRGHCVTMLTGEAYRQVAAEHGLSFRALPPSTDVRPVERIGHPRSRVGKGREEIIDTFVRPLHAQHDAIVGILSESRCDAVVSDSAFLGVLPLLLSRPRSQRIPVLGVSVTPLSVTSVDCAPFGTALQPGHTPRTRRRNRRIQWLLRHGPLRGLHDQLDASLAIYGIPPGAVDYFDVVTAFDLTFHLSAPEFEYPRRELPASVRFVGPLPAAAAPTPATLPSWWPELLTDRPVVHVTQGTMANVDPRKLIVPSIRGLADEPVLTVVATGGRPVRELLDTWRAPLPDNVRVAEFLPYDQLLPHSDVVVSNGGYGGVQQALRHATPLVVAGDTEDKPEVAARVHRVGAGVDLRTGSPSPRQVRRAVRAVLGEPAYRQQAERMSEAIVRMDDPRLTIVAAVEAEVAVRAR